MMVSNTVRRATSARRANGIVARLADAPALRTVDKTRILQALDRVPVLEDVEAAELADDAAKAS